MDEQLREILGRNFELSYLTTTDPTPQYLTCKFYASNINIVIEDEPIGSEKVLASGEIRIRYKKRLVINLKVPFFSRFNNFVSEEAPGYAEFETMINCHTLHFKWLGNDFTSKHDYYFNNANKPNLEPFNESIINPDGIDIILKEKQTEFLDGYYDKKIIQVTFWETKNWYSAI
jgi:hypothetical protein